MNSWQDLLKTNLTEEEKEKTDKTKAWAQKEELIMVFQEFF
jgi:hypothetical protein